MKDWKELKPHKLNQFPAMQDWEFQELKKSINKGFDERMPIIVYIEENGNKGIIDGANRHRACLETNTIPLIRDFYGSYQKAVDFILKSNVRRNLSAGQKAAVVLDMDEVINELVEAASIRMNSGVKAESDPGAVLHQGQNEPRTAKVVADMAGVGARTVNQAKKIKEVDPELYEYVKSGNISADSAYNQIKDKVISADRDLDIQRRAKQLLKSSVAQALENQKDELYELALETVTKAYDEEAKTFEFNLKITKI